VNTSESCKIEQMRRLAQRLREYSARGTFACYAESMACVAQELDQCADKAAARMGAVQ
jgi:hypothetical protein